MLTYVSDLLAAVIAGSNNQLGTGALNLLRFEFPGLHTYVYPLRLSYESTTGTTAVAIQPVRSQLPVVPGSGTDNVSRFFENAAFAP
jgi:hypothetical protein